MIDKIIKLANKRFSFVEGLHFLVAMVGFSFIISKLTGVNIKVFGLAFIFFGVFLQIVKWKTNIRNKK